MTDNQPTPDEVRHSNRGPLERARAAGDASARHADLARQYADVRGEAILQAYSEGMSLSEIGNELSFTKANVQRIIERTRGRLGVAADPLPETTRRRLKRLRDRAVGIDHAELDSLLKDVAAFNAALATTAEKMQATQAEPDR